MLKHHLFRNHFLWFTLLLFHGPKPPIVVLCGSTRFEKAYEDAMKSETLAGKVVLSVGLLGHKVGLDMGGLIKKMLNELHLRKIDIADEVLVLNVLQRICPKCETRWRHDAIKVFICSNCATDISEVQPIGYIGESTSREIAYAKLHGKSVRYLNPV